MKTNKPHQWTITLRGKTRSKTAGFMGTLDEALHEADVMESNVAFVVLEFVVTRGERARAKTIAARGNTHRADSVRSAA